MSKTNLYSAIVYTHDREPERSEKSFKSFSKAQIWCKDTAVHNRDVYVIIQQKQGQHLVVECGTISNLWLTYEEQEELRRL